MHDTTTLSTFLSHLWRGGEWAFLCTDRMVGDDIKHGKSVWFETQAIDRGLTLTASNDYIGVYFGVHPSTRIPPFSKKGNPDQRFIRSQLEYLAAINCLFGEIDGGITLDDLLTRQPQPGVVILSSPGKFHAYWLLRDTVVINDDNRDYLAHIQREWVAFVGSDPDSANLNRVLRMPGTTNRKPKYAPSYPLVQFEYVNFEMLYSLDELAALLPAFTPRAPRSIVQFEYTDYEIIRLRNTVFALAKERCEDRELWVKVLLALHTLGDIGETIAREWSMQSCKYDEKGFDKAWKSITDRSDGLTVASIYRWYSQDAERYYRGNIE